MTKIKKPEEQQGIIEDYTNTLKRLQAEFENYIKRVEKEKQEFINYSNHRLLAKLLTIADDFENALGIVKEKGGDIAEGIEMIHKQLSKLLAEEGVRPIESVGNKLDPFKHDVVEVVNGEDDVVVEEFQKGYMLNEKVLRPAKVRISKGKVEENV